MPGGSWILGAWPRAPRARHWIPDPHPEFGARARRRSSSLMVAGLRRRRLRAHGPLRGLVVARRRDGLPGHVPAVRSSTSVLDEPAVTADPSSPASPRRWRSARSTRTLVFPYPLPTRRGGREGPRPDRAASATTPRSTSTRGEIDETGRIADQVYRDLGELGLMGLYVAEEYGGQGLSQTGYARVFEAIGQVDGSLTIGMGVHQSIGIKGIAHLRDRRAEGALPARPGGGPQARGLRADRAQRGLGRLQHRVARGAAGRRLVGAQRREALDRQRLPRRRVRDLRARRGRRQGLATSR